MGTISGVRHLARQPSWRRWTLGSFLARLPVTMTLIALVLLGVEVADSVAVGAQLSGVALVASGLAALWRGRVLDRGELTAGLRRDCLLTAAALAALAVAAVTDAPTAVLFGLAAVQGVAMAALSGGFRALLPAVVPMGDVPRANSIEAIFVEVAFVTGPAAAGILAVWLGPVGVLGVMAASVCVAAWIVSGLPPLHPPAERSPSSPWNVPGVRPVLGLALAMGATLGMFESLIPARVVALGFEAEISGPLLALIALGSGIGGFAASSWASTALDVRRPAVLLLLAFGLLVAPAGFAPTLIVLGVVLLFSGMPIAPLNAFGSIRLHGIVPSGRQAEGFSVYLAAVMLGAGGGQSLVGLILPIFGPERLLVATGAIPVLAALAVVVVSGRDLFTRSARDDSPHPAP